MMTVTGRKERKVSGAVNQRKYLKPCITSAVCSYAIQTALNQLSGSDQAGIEKYLGDVVELAMEAGYHIVVPCQIIPPKKYFE